MKNSSNRRGVALLLALVFAVVLLQMAIAYSSMTADQSLRRFRSTKESNSIISPMA